MAVKVLITRRFKEGKALEVLAALNQLRAKALNYPGYITGETLFGHDDSNKLVVIGTWQSMEDWANWRNNPDRKEIEGRLLQLLAEPPQYETFVFGTYPYGK